MKQVEVLKVLKPAEHEQQPESIEVIFPEDLENNKIKKENRKRHCQKLFEIWNK